MLFETFLFPLQYLGVSFTVTGIVYVIYLKATQYSNTKITPIWTHISVIYDLDCLFCFHIYCKNYPCGWVSPYTSFGKHIPGYHGTSLHSDSCKRVLVTELIKLYSRKTAVGEPRHWRNSLALPRTMGRETHQKFSNMRLSLLITG